MDYNLAIRQLRAELDRIDRTIQRLEALPADAIRRQQNRGRRSVPAEERAEISLRMKRYWEQWRERKRSCSVPRRCDELPGGDL
jgi:hypothetical protein